MHPSFDDEFVTQIPLTEPSQRARKPLEPIQNEQRYCERGLSLGNTAESGESVMNAEKYRRVTEPANMEPYFSQSIRRHAAATALTGSDGPKQEEMPAPRPLNPPQTKFQTAAGPHPSQVDRVDQPQLTRQQSRRHSRPFQRWREAGQRRIPRRLTKIPKNQLLMLESEDSWQPPLPGKLPLEVNIPECIWNCLIEAADQRCTQSRSQAQELTGNKSEDECGKASSISNNENNRSMIYENHFEPQNSDDDSSELGPSQWSQSPEANISRKSLECPSNLSQNTEISLSQISPEYKQPKLRTLPPDSSPPMTPAEGIQYDRQRPNHEDEYLSVPTQRTNIEVRDTNNENSSVIKQPADENSTSIHDEYSRHHEPGRISTSSQLRLGRSTSPAVENTVSRTVKNTVHVKRTPYPPKAIVSEVDSLRSSNSFVGGTFDEKLVSQNVLHSDHQLMDLRGQTPSTFEDNSSEESQTSSMDQSRTSEEVKCESVTSRGRQSISDGDLIDGDKDSRSRLSRSSIEGGESTRSPLLDSINHEQAKPRPKRKQSDSLKSIGGNKRRATNRPRSIPEQDRIPDPDILVVLNKHLGDRKAIISECKRQRVERERTELEKRHSEQAILEGLKSGPSTSTLVNPASTSPAVCTGPRFSSSISSPSPLLTLKRKQHILTSSDTGSYTQLNVVGVYKLFQKAYPEYKGTLPQFKNACHLIKTLREGDRAPHQSLWDDFIYRLVHDYQQYVSEVIVAGGSVEEYATFYDKYVEAPEHRKRIVRASFIDSQGRTLQLSEGRGSEKSFSHIDKSSIIKRTTGNLSSKVSPRSSDAQMLTFHNQVSSKHNTASDVFSNPSDPRAETDSCEGAIDRSQNRSVRLWLDKAPGLESPDLGTPDEMKTPDEITHFSLEAERVAEQQALDELPCGSPEADEAIRERNSNSKDMRSLSRSSGRERSPDSSASLKDEDVTRLPTAYAKVPLAESSPRFITQQAVDLPLKTNAEENRLSRTVPSSNPEPKVERSGQPWWRDDQTPFKLFVGNYRRLPAETFVAWDETAADVRRIIDIFSWRG